MRSLWLGRVDYGLAWRLQREMATLRAAGGVGDVLLLLEHPPTITLGRGANRAHLLVSPDRLAQEGIALYEVDRGGDATYHGPGQLVGYPILDLARHGRDLHLFLRQLEGVLIAVLEEYGIDARRFSPHTGVWVGDRKIAAMGIKVSRWITTHGFALNVTTPLDEFRSIVPCGIAEYGVTSLLRESGDAHELAEVAARAAVCFERAFPNHEYAPPAPPNGFSESSAKILAAALDIGNYRC